MSYLSLGLNLHVRFGMDPWFVMKRAVAHHNATVSCGSMDNPQQTAYELFLINLCKSPKLITWNSTSTLQSEVSEEMSTKSSPRVSPPTQRKRPVRRQRLPKICISDEDCNLGMALVTKVDLNSTSLNPTTSFIPLTEEQSENFHIFNDLLAEHNVSIISSPSVSTSNLPSIISNSSRGTKRPLPKSQPFGAPVSKKSKATLHWTEILDDLMTASDWEEAEAELQQENKPISTTSSLNETLSFIPLTEDESENFHIFNDLLAEHTASAISTSSVSTSKPTPITLNPQQTLKSSASTLATTTSSSSLNTTTSSNSNSSKPSSKVFRDNERQLHWSEILDSLMTDEDRIDAEESFTIPLPLCEESAPEFVSVDETYSLPSTPSSNIPSSYSSAQNTHSLPTPIEELKDPFGLILSQNSCCYADMSFELVKSSLEQNDYFSKDLSFNIEKSFLELDFDFENSFC
ncbi:uncharacterized protein MELLADRAFT_103286 [Melampsora larici-populina 98AG31]|uniref:Uncharacterized protein n=1 Tax=Melampsora larici-populina (strain 98AG31 / pathotype 3-4-7) TaxID=747676 RepID=F4R9X3_MELLP|nr:uncharacterized protein MELLADRAFT_103286 [Melampsora larici-populina 98AG31]EGG10603.1 hypothetical protein MELLADRAFT_103286 [Melampsora larici-populina 98AG31]